MPHSAAATTKAVCVTIRRISQDFQRNSSSSTAGDTNGHEEGKETLLQVPIVTNPIKRTGWRHRYVGILFTFCASLTFSLGVLFAKLLQAYNYHGNCTSFWRYTGVTVPAIPLMLYCEFGHLCCYGRSPTRGSSSYSSVSESEPLKRHGHVSTFSEVWPLSDREKRRMALYVLLRGFIAAIGVVLRFYALDYLPIGDASVITYSTPVLVTILAHFILGERAGVISFVVAFTTLIGVVIVAKPPILTGAASFTTDSLIGTGLAIASLVCSSAQIILTRKVRSVHFALLTLTVGLIGLTISTALLLYFQDFQYPTGTTDGLYVAGLTGCSFLGQMSIILALKFEQAGPVSLIRTSDIVIGFVLQYAFLYVVPEWTSVVGGAIVVTGVLVTSARKWVQELPEDDTRRRRYQFLLI